MIVVRNMTHPAWDVRTVVDDNPQMVPMFLHRRQVQHSLKERRDSLGPPAEDSDRFHNRLTPFSAGETFRQIR